MFISLVRFPTAFADRQKEEFLMEVMFLSRRMHESVPIRNQHTSTWRDWQSAAVGQSLLSAQGKVGANRWIWFGDWMTNRRLIRRLHYQRDPAVSNVHLSSFWDIAKYEQQEWLYWICTSFWQGKDKKTCFAFDCTIFHASTSEKMSRKKLLLGFFKKIRFKLQVYSVGLLNFFLQIQDQERIGLYSK